MANIRQQFSILLGWEVKKTIRLTDEEPPRISVVDVMSVIQGHTNSNAAVAFTRMTRDYPEVAAQCGMYKFSDTLGRKGQKNTPVANVRGMVRGLVLLLFSSYLRVC